MRQCPYEGHAGVGTRYSATAAPARSHTPGRRVASPSLNRLEMKLMEFRLYFRRKYTGIRVIRDVKYARMWRISGVGGELSDMVNLTRAKDAALTWARAAHPEAERGSSEQFSWKCAEWGGEEIGRASCRERV